MEDCMIPQEKSDAVTRGLREAFGVTEFEDIRMITTGLSSALVFRIVVQGRPYLLRIITRTDAINDPTRQFACMRAAAEAGLAPHVWYTSIEDRISITGFVDAMPFPLADALVRMPRILRRLHALPPFPKTLNYLEAMDGFIRRFQAARLLPDSETEAVFQRYDELAAVYQRLEPDLVSCHSDLKPENILFDGDDVWLVDWEASFLTDRYLDLAVVANFVITSDAAEGVYLREYFGQAPNEYQRARFFLMRQALHMCYAAMFLVIGSSGQPVNLEEPAPEFSDFHQRMWAGEVDLADSAVKIAYGRVHWEAFCRNTRHARYCEAVRIVA
jgi:aminoglycoside phosphotransferase (APT) family kinase protein